jgi:hypothetical protein
VTVQVLQNASGFWGADWCRYPIQHHSAATRRRKRQTPEAEAEAGMLLQCSECHLALASWLKVQMSAQEQLVPNKDGIMKPKVLSLQAESMEEILEWERCIQLAVALIRSVVVCCCWFCYELTCERVVSVYLIALPVALYPLRSRRPRRAQPQSGRSRRCSDYGLRSCTRFITPQSFRRSNRWYELMVLVLADNFN